MAKPKRKPAARKSASRKPGAKSPVRKPARKSAPRRNAPKAARAPAGPVKGMHAMFYSSQPAELRAFLRDMLGFPGTDVGEGWLIMDLPAADLGVHPTEGADYVSGTTHLSFYCDDIEQAMRELMTRGVEFTQQVQDQGWGLVARMRVPGGFEVDLYQPRYRK